jgi:hypothetical protein
MSAYFLVIKEINKYLVDMILINSFRSGTIRKNHSNSTFRFSKNVTKATNKTNNYKWSSHGQLVSKIKMSNT